jgi:hypothetical protein
MKRLVAFVLAVFSFVACVYTGVITFRVALDFIHDGGSVWGHVILAAAPTVMSISAGALGLLLLRFALASKAQTQK